MIETPQHQTPGQLIADLLEQRGWTRRVLAVVLKTDEAALSKVIAGKRPLTAELALVLGELFGEAPERFLELQHKYDLARARLVSRPDPGRAVRAHLFGGLPIAAMISRGWLAAKDVRDVPRVESELVRFFGARSVADIEVLPHAAKKTDLSDKATPAQLAWIYRVKQIAGEMLVPRYSTATGQDAIERLKPLREYPEEMRKVPRILAESGIRFVIVESLPGAKIDGVCFWIGESPVVGLSMRHDRVDNFWFVLRHELEHVQRRHGQGGTVLLDADLEGARAGVGDDVDQEEREANEAAAEFCVPQDALRRFIARKDPFFAERDILGFARTIRVHPGLVAGQLQHKTGRYDRFRQHHVKARAHVAPSAVVDGWGDVAPTDR